MVSDPVLQTLLFHFLFLKVFCVGCCVGWVRLVGSLFWIFVVVVVKSILCGLLCELGQVCWFVVVSLTTS